MLQTLQFSQIRSILDFIYHETQTLQCAPLTPQISHLLHPKLLFSLKRTMKSSFQMQATKPSLSFDTKSTKSPGTDVPTGAILKGRQEPGCHQHLGLAPALFLSPDPGGAGGLRSESSRSASICPQRKTHLPREKSLPAILLLGCARSCQSSFSLLQLWDQSTHLGPKQRRKEPKIASFQLLAENFPR